MTAVEPQLEVGERPARWVYFDLTAGKVVCAFSLVLYGYALRNPSSSVAAAADLYDATDTVSAQTVFPLTLASSESLADWFGPNGIWLQNGLYVNVTAGEVKGAVFYRHHRG